MFKGLLIEKTGSGSRATVAELDDSMLPAGDVTVRIAYSTLNYKDALAIAGKAPIVRSFPMIPGIDLARSIESSGNADLRVGDQVLVNGHGLGESHWGGLAQRARVPGPWLQPLPAGLTSRDAMTIGTAGYTAMLCVLALQDRGVDPSLGEVLVTGANGGVGSFAVGLLARLGYTVVAATGRPHAAARLEALGASSVIDRSALSEPGKPLQKERWAGVIDSVGSHTLANACAQMRYGGAVAACGMAQGLDLPASVAPFILRGVALLGVDSVQAPRMLRIRAWQRLAELAPPLLAGMAEEIPLGQASAAAVRLLEGRIEGRLVVDVNAD